jgi:hypothetical protein
VGPQPRPDLFSLRIEHRVADGEAVVFDLIERVAPQDLGLGQRGGSHRIQRRRVTACQLPAMRPPPSLLRGCPTHSRNSTPAIRPANRNSFEAFDSSTSSRTKRKRGQAVRPNPFCFLVAGEGLNLRPLGYENTRKVASSRQEATGRDSISLSSRQLSLPVASRSLHFRPTCRRLASPKNRSSPAPGTPPPSHARRAATQASALADASWELLQKPLCAGQLAGEVRSVLDRANA